LISVKKIKVRKGTSLLKKKQKKKKKRKRTPL
jgi:hypothetical protein